MSATLRCFLAVKLPLEATNRVAEAQAQLKAAEPKWKWVPLENFHLTMKFLGEIERPQLEALWGAVQAQLEAVRAIRVQLKGLGVFPNARAPRVAWAGVETGAAELAELADKIETACEAYGFPREQRPFTAHLTIGRAREVKPAPELMTVLEAFKETVFGEGTVDRVLLMQSTLTRAGAVYNSIFEQELQQGEAT
jgi:RNA 2',3'-cyclic 3'-phosphodiesterase